MGSYVHGFWDGKVKPVLEEINNLGGSDEMHVAIPFGDDFAFQRGMNCFDKMEELMDECRDKGGSEYDVVAKQSSLMDYFKDFEKMDLPAGLFKGDFLPYVEPQYSWSDFWTGYYTTRPMQKQFTRYVFNRLQSTKTLFALSTLHDNDYSIDFDGAHKSSKDLDQIGKHIDKAS